MLLLSTIWRAAAAMSGRQPYRPARARCRVQPRSPDWTRSRPPGPSAVPPVARMTSVFSELHEFVDQRACSAVLDHLDRQLPVRLPASAASCQRPRRIDRSTRAPPDAGDMHDGVSGHQCRQHLEVDRSRNRIGGRHKRKDDARRLRDLRQSRVHVHPERGLTKSQSSVVFDEGQAGELVLEFLVFGNAETGFLDRPVTVFARLGMRCFGGGLGDGIGALAVITLVHLRLPMRARSSIMSAAGAHRRFGDWLMSTRLCDCRSPSRPPCDSGARP